MNHIKFIDLSFNKLSEEGAKWMSDALIGKQLLETLYLSENNFLGNSMKYIASALKTTPMIATLYMRKN